MRKKKKKRQKKKRETAGAEKREKQKMRENWNKILFFINFVVTISCYF